MLDNYHSSLKKQALEDLTMRARGGIFMYLAVWFITAFWADIVTISPTFFYLNSFLFIVIAALRGSHYLTVKKKPDSDVDVMSQRLVLLILASAFHWGILSSWIIYRPEYAALHYPYMIIIAAFAIGGTSTLSISKEIRIFYPLFIFAPSLLLALYQGGGEYQVLFVLAVFSLIYVFEASRVSSKDYWEAINNHKIADERAQMMEQLSITDPLTKLYNRLFFNQQFTKEWKRCNRQKIPLSIMMMDLDHFKKVNDTYGHVFGDKCLQEVAATLKQELPRVTDTVARYGGEEFVILLPNTKLEDAEIIAEKLINVISLLRFTFDGKNISISCSIGLACTIPDHTSHNQSFLIAADKALYQAKNNGRNQWKIAQIEEDITLPPATD